MHSNLTNAPTTFQSLTNNIFHGLLLKFVLVSFDDILVYTGDWVAHLHHLEIVLQTLRQHRLYCMLNSQNAHLG